jgi:hypothetical protein
MSRNPGAIRGESLQAETRRASEAGALYKSLRNPSYPLMSTPPPPESPDNEGLYKKMKRLNIE